MSFVILPQIRASHSARSQTISTSPASAGVYGQFPDSSTSSNSTSGINITNNWYRRCYLAFTYTYNELTNNGTNELTGGAEFSALKFVQTGIPTYRPFPNYAIAMMHMPSNSANTANPSLTTSGRTNFTVVTNPFSFNAYFTGTYTISFNTPFSYNGTDAIGFIFAWGQTNTNYSQSGQSYKSDTGTTHYTRTDSSGTYFVTETNVTTSTVSYRPALSLVVS